MGSLRLWRERIRCELAAPWMVQEANVGESSSSGNCKRCEERHAVCTVREGGRACEFCRRQKKQCVVAGVPTNRPRQTSRSQEASRKRKVREIEDVGRSRQKCRQVVESKSEKELLEERGIVAAME